MKAEWTNCFLKVKTLIKQFSKASCSDVESRFTIFYSLVLQKEGGLSDDIKVGVHVIVNVQRLSALDKNSTAERFSLPGEKSGERGSSSLGDTSDPDFGVITVVIGFGNQIDKIVDVVDGFLDLRLARTFSEFIGGLIPSSFEGANVEPGVLVLAAKGSEDAFRGSRADDSGVERSVYGSAS